MRTTPESEAPSPESFASPDLDHSTINVRLAAGRCWRLLMSKRSEVTPTVPLLPYCLAAGSGGAKWRTWTSSRSSSPRITGPWLISSAKVGTSAPSGGELEQIQFLLGYILVETTERYLGANSGCATSRTTESGWSRSGELMDGTPPNIH
jgi:hypothetical protein